MLTDYTEVSSLISSVMIAKVSKEGDPPLLFHTFRCRLRDRINSYDLGYDMSLISGATVLPIAAGPYSNQGDVVPIALPLYYVPSYTGVDMVLMTDDVSSADVILYLFLGIDNIESYLQMYCNDNYQGSLHVAYLDGKNISLSSGRSDTGTAGDDVIVSAVGLAISEGLTYFTLDQNHIYVNPVDNTGLYVINIIPFSQFTSGSQTLLQEIGILALASTLFITAISLLIVYFVTSPLKKLMYSVHAIENNSYDGKADIRSKDEVGQLNDSIDSMYNTIQQQIIRIKAEEQEKYNAKIQLLSEQINPHFLYNTLECINMEVYNCHTETASSMISDLGNYLRISLAYGESELLVSQEIEQVKAYVNIMNYRFRHSIQITINVPEELMNCRIVKCILQPLAENSLKHGFKIGINNIFPITPILEIAMTRDGDRVILSVTDNGAGIDIHRATQIMKNKQANGASDKHIGLNNIYERLTAYYKDVDICFSSIPFFENKVIISLPGSLFQS